MRTIREIDHERLVVQEALDNRRTRAERNELGQFATPPALALEMAKYARELLPKKAAIRFLDPAIGTGAFFAAMRQVFPSFRITAARGVEIDQALAAEAKRLWAPLGLKVTTGDFTRQNTDREAATLVLTNPPYVRHHHLGQDEKVRLQAAAADLLGLEVNGLTGLYVYFLLLSDAWMAEDALALWLIPSEFMDVNYGATLKRYLAERVTLLRIHRFDPRQVQFGDALVSSAIVVFRKSRPPKGQMANFTYGGGLLDPERSESIGADELRTARKWTQYPRTRRCPATKKPGRLVLGDIFKIQRGIATGANEFFILPRDEAKRRDLPEKFLRPILPSPRKLHETVILDSGDGYPKIPTPLALIDCSLPEREVRESYPGLWGYLKSAPPDLLARYLICKRDPWYGQEERAPAPFLCTYMGRGVGVKKPFRFLLNLSKAIATNVYLMLYPVGRLAEVLDDDPRLLKTVFELLQAVNADDLRGEGRVYGGGLHKIEPKELGRISAEVFLKKIDPLRETLARQAELSFDRA